MRTNSALSNLLLALVLAVGATGLWTVFGGYVIDALPIGPSEPICQEAISLQKDGTPLIMRYVDGLHTQEYRDLEGQPVIPPVDAANISPAFLAKTWGRLNLVESPRLADGQSPSGYWYLLEDEKSTDQRGYFAGFDSQNKRCIGYLGINGFQPEVPSLENMFPGVRRGSRGAEKGLYFVAEAPGLSVYAQAGSRSLPSVFVPTSDGKLYLADLQKRTVNVVHDGEPLLSAAKLYQPEGTNSRVRWCIALRTATSIEVLDAIDGHFLRRFSIPDEFRTEDFMFGLTSNAEMVLEIADQYGEAFKSTNNVRIVQIHANGTKEDHTVTLAQIARGKRFQATGGLRVPAPVFLAAEIALDRGSEIMQGKLEPSWNATARRLASEYYPTFLLAVGISLACAIATLVRLTRYSASRTERILWPLFVLLFGVPGWIGFRVCRTWPVLEACGNCNVRVPRNHEECVACATEFPLPAELGTEVFA
jgi:hypothetical protein